MMNTNLATLFELAVDTLPQRLALIAGDSRLSFLEIEQQANRLANHFVEKGIKANDKIGIHSYNRAEWIIAMLAAYKVRAVPININFRYVEEELLYLYDNADLVALVFEKQFAPVIEKIDAKLPLLKHYIVLEDESDVEDISLSVTKYEDLEQYSTSRDFLAHIGERSGDDIYMLYTGGTTGLPKGAVWRHEDIFYGALQGGNPGGEPLQSHQELIEKLKAAEEGVTVSPAPLMHGGGGWTALMSLLGGTTCALYCDAQFSGESLCQLLQDEKALVILIIGDAMARPIAEALANNPGKYDLSNLFLLSSGGAILSRSIKEQLKRLLPHVFLLDGYGSSETGHMGSVMADRDDTDSPCFTISDKCQVLHPETLEAIEQGSSTPGLFARSGHIPQGYYKDEAKTAATFKVDKEGVRWVIPGDWAIVESDGTARLLGRGSGCINSGGEKIYPEEVESALKTHPEVFDAAVVGVPCPRFTEKAVALIQPREGKQPALEDLSSFCSEKVASYKLPKEVIMVEAVPRTPVGKPDYREVKRIALEALGL